MFRVYSRFFDSCQVRIEPTKVTMRLRLSYSLGRKD